MSIVKKLIPLIIAGAMAVYEAYSAQKQEEEIEELKNRVDELEKDEVKTEEEES